MPFRARRDGLALGEGAALLALVRAGESKGPVFGHVLGFGASSDAVHVTAPDRAGAGLVRAARAALRDAEISPSSIGLVSAHGTGTSYNDAAESRAIQAVLAESAARAIVQPYKGVIGHTLGAAGALETLAASAALGLGLAPAAHGSGEVEPSLTARLLDRAESSDATHALKLSSAFGGANAALVVSARPAGESSRARLAREVRVLAVGEPVVTVPNPSELTGRVATDAVKLARMDPVSLLCVCACVGLRDAISAPAETGVIVGTSAATLEIDAEFERRRKTRGAEPRRFPGTSPNLAPGECSIAFGLLGPAFAVGADRAAGLEALLVAHDLVAGGDAEAFLVVAVDHVADFVREVWRSAGWAPPTPGALAVLIGMGGEGPALERGDLASALTLARAAGGAWAGAGPGWPALLRMFEAK